MPKTEFGPTVWGKLDKKLVGDPVTVDAWTVTPVARLRGSQGGKVEGVNGGGGARLRLDPVAVTVANPDDGSAQRVEIDDPTSAALRGMAGVGMVVAGISLAVQLWMRVGKKK